MRKKVLSVILGMLMAFPVTAYLPAKAYMLPPYRLEARDLGMVLAPSKPGRNFINMTAAASGEGIVTEVDGTYYLFYDGAGMCEGPCPGNDYQNHLWRACLAKSTDMINWTKLGRAFGAAMT